MTYEKPRPRIDETSQPYWDAAKRHQLVCQQCSQCGEFMFPPTTVCERCLSSDLNWTPISGKGTVWSFILMHQKYYESFADEIPYNVAVIRSSEGPKFVTNLVDIDNEHIKVDMPVEITFEDVDEDLTIPKWRPAGTP